MSLKPTAVFILGDSPIHISEGTCGGGEVATISLAKAFYKLGYRTLVFGNIPAGDVNHLGIEFINYGLDYNMNLVQEKLRNVGPYYAFAATFVHPFLILKNDKNCLSKILINHSPGINPGGLEASTVLNIVDYQVSVSNAQRALVFSRGIVPIEQLPVVKNGFDPDLFKYFGPENRDFNRLVFTGRLEYAKGIEVLLPAYLGIKKEFPDVKLDIYGSGASWPEATAVVKNLCSEDPNIRYHGVVPQNVIADALSKCGLLLFPSVTFESAGLAVLDAQASGCPVVANAVGGVPEYVFEGKCGVLVRGTNAKKFELEVSNLLRNKELLKQMSANCESIARKHTWEVVAKQLLDLIARKNKSQTKDFDNPLSLIFKNDILRRCWNSQGEGINKLLEDHQDIMNGLVVSEEFIDKLIGSDPSLSITHFWKALILDKKGDKFLAADSYKKSIELSNKMDWQPLYWLTVLMANIGNTKEAGRYALDIISLHTKFPMKVQLEKIVELSGILTQKAHSYE